LNSSTKVGFSVSLLTSLANQLLSLHHTKARARSPSPLACEATHARRLTAASLPPLDHRANHRLAATLPPVGLRLIELTRAAYLDCYLVFREQEITDRTLELLKSIQLTPQARFRASQVTQQDVLQADAE
jgi:hypothetical protein